MLLLCISARPRSITTLISSTRLEKKNGKGMTATLFVKGGDDTSRVSTSVPKPDGSGRAIVLFWPGRRSKRSMRAKAYYGEVPILGTPYITGYEPIKDSSGAAIGIYYGRLQEVTEPSEEFSFRTAKLRKRLSRCRLPYLRELRSSWIFKARRLGHE